MRPAVWLLPALLISPGTGSDDAITAPAARAMSRAHIVFLLADEVGWNSVGWHSNITLSPHL
eukprot:SAG31_NODE_21123_length_557_cov_1.017467_1_plen_61_part_01